jgi:glutamate racemase
MRNDCYIGVFDSGVGGTTVLKWIKKLLPRENIIYFGDTKNAPYGNKCHEEIRELSINAGDFLVRNGCKALVIACNTATAAAYDELRDRYPDIPVVGVIEAGAKVAVTSARRKIAVIGTEYTVQSKAYLKEVRRYNKDLKIVQIACKELCSLIEKGWEETEEGEKLLEEYLKQIPPEIDTLILGCTHYPLIKDSIEKYFQGRIIDPGAETALELKKLLENKKLLSLRDKKGKAEYFVSGEKIHFKEIAEKFLGIKIEKVYSINF